MFDEIRTFLQGIERETGIEFFIVGGAVRDSLLGIPTKDIDLVARNLPHDQLMNALGQFGGTEITGREFAVIRFFPRSVDFPMMEISLPRTEISTGSGHTDFETDFDHNMPIENDLVRRDFTINAIACRVADGELIAPEGALDDIENRVLRIMHKESAQEDPLRILRGVRFLSKLDVTVDDETRQLLSGAVDGLATVSAERIQDELLKMVTGDRIADALRFAQEIGALAIILPELEACVGCEQNAHHSFDVFEHIIRVVENTPTDDPFVKLAALFHDIAKPPTRWTRHDGRNHFYEPAPDETDIAVEPEIRGNHEIVGADMARTIMKRLKFSNRNTDRVAALVREHMFIQGTNLRRPAARRLLNRFSHVPGDIQENMDALFALRRGDILGGKTNVNEDFIAMNDAFQKVVNDEIASETAFRVSDLAVSGQDIMDELDIEPGPEVGRILNMLFQEVLEDERLNTRENLMSILNEWGGG